MIFDNEKKSVLKQCTKIGCLVTYKQNGSLRARRETTAIVSNFLWGVVSFDSLHTKTEQKNNSSIVLRPVHNSTFDNLKTCI